MKNLKKDLQDVSKQLQILADKTERWLRMLEKYEKPKAKKKPQAKTGKPKEVKNGKEQKYHERIPTLWIFTLPQMSKR